MRHNKRRDAHGKLTNPREYQSWRSMRSRCINPKASHWKYWGGAGITVCERWDSFSNFLADMGPRPDGTTLDRFPNNTGNYEPGNCRWATAYQQIHNRGPIKFRGPKDISGQRFGGVVALRISHVKQVAYWVCRCDCGNEKVIDGSTLRKRAKLGKPIGCGCLRGNHGNHRNAHALQ